MRSLRVDVTPAVFRWLRQSSGWSKDDIAKRPQTSIDIVEALEKGEQPPTLRQLKELSKAYKHPLASFLLSEPIKEAYLPKDYRMLLDKKDVFDKKTIYAIRKARSLQKIGSELSGNIDYSTKPTIDKASIRDNPDVVRNCPQ